MYRLVMHHRLNIMFIKIFWKNIHMSNIRTDNRTKNLNPKFIVPSHYTHKIPFILSEAIKRNQHRDLTAEVHFYLSLPP